jgi:putative hydrolase of the HAD superfamily
VIETVCFDFGDNLIAEGTVVHNSSGQAITAQIADYAFEVLEAIKKGGCKIAVIANGDSAGARNIIASCGLEDYFDAIVISKELGIEKPAREIFETALYDLKSKAENAIMVGKRIDADIVGANTAGIKSVWFRWHDRYQETIEDEGERPAFIIKSLPKLLGILGLS